MPERKVLSEMEEISRRRFSPVLCIAVQLFSRRFGCFGLSFPPDDHVSPKQSRKGRKLLGSVNCRFVQCSLDNSPVIWTSGHLVEEAFEVEPIWIYEPTLESCSCETVMRYRCEQKQQWQYSANQDLRERCNFGQCEIRI